MIAPGARVCLDVAENRVKDLVALIPDEQSRPACQAVGSFLILLVEAALEQSAANAEAQRQPPTFTPR